MADDDARTRHPQDDRDENDGVREAVEATHATVHSALDRIRASREILADSLKPIDELLDDLRENGGRGEGGVLGSAGGGRPPAGDAEAAPPGA